MGGLNMRGTAAVMPESGGLNLRECAQKPAGQIPNNPMARQGPVKSKSPSGDQGLRIRRLTTVSPGAKQPHPFTRHSPAKAKMSPKSAKGKAVVHEMMSEVMHNEPSTVARANVSAERKQQMRVAIGLSKARKAGVRIPKKR